METLYIQKGESTTLTFILSNIIPTDITDVILQVGNLVFSLSGNTVEQDDLNPLIFLLKISSNQTHTLKGNYPICMALVTTTYVKKTDTLLNLVVEEHISTYNNPNKSSITSSITEVNIPDPVTLTNLSNVKIRRGETFTIKVNITGVDISTLDYLAINIGSTVYTVANNGLITNPLDDTEYTIRLSSTETQNLTNKQKIELILSSPTLGVNKTKGLFVLETDNTSNYFNTNFKSENFIDVSLIANIVITEVEVEAILPLFTYNTQTVILDILKGTGGGGGGPWTEIIANQVLEHGKNYITNSATKLELTLPAVTSLNPTRVASKLGGWKILIPVGYQVLISDEVITQDLESTLVTDTIELLPLGPNTYKIVNIVGNINFNNL